MARSHIAKTIGHVVTYYALINLMLQLPSEPYFALSSVKFQSSHVSCMILNCSININMPLALDAGD